MANTFKLTKLSDESFEKKSLAELKTAAEEEQDTYYIPAFKKDSANYKVPVDNFNIKPSIDKVFHATPGNTYTWRYIGSSSNYSKAAVIIEDLAPIKLYHIDFNMRYSQNYASSPEMYVFASASESNMGVPTGYSRISSIVGSTVSNMTPRLINCSWTLKSSIDGKIYINIVGDADPNNTTNRVTLYNINYTATRLEL